MERKSTSELDVRMARWQLLDMANFHPRPTELDLGD